MLASKNVERFYMLDSTVNLFNVSVSPVETNSNKSLILSGCRVMLADESLYSEIEELNFYRLNSNDYGFGFMSLEMSFDGVLCSYARFFVQCVTLRINNRVLFKINRGPSFFDSINKCYTKINKEGKMVLGVDYYFKTEEERRLILNCDSFCFEGFMALNNKMNVYSFVCKAQKNGDNWVLLDGNTYKTTKFQSIDSFVH